MTPRGLSNFNPGNIRISDINYQGEIRPSIDKSFKQFQSMAFGYRAIFKDMYAKIHNNPPINTINKIISMWAPKKDNNNTDNYIKTVCSRAGLKPDDIVHDDIAVITKIVCAISFVENGIEANSVDISNAIQILNK